MTEAQQEFQRGFKAFKAGNRSDALSGFLMALALDPDTPDHRRYAVEVLGTSSGYTSLPQPVLEGLARCSVDPNLDVQPLAMVVLTLLSHNPMCEKWLPIIRGRDTATVENALAEGLFDSLLTDPLIDAVLGQAINISVDLEEILTGLRHHALACATFGSSSVLLSRHRAFFKSLAIQAERTDFAWSQSALESAWLDDLEGQTDSQLIISAYRRTNPSVQQDLPHLTSISDSVSIAVADQYTNFPYPRWERLTTTTARSLLEILNERFPTETWAPHLSGPASGLSAGCGTGRGALLMAQSISDLSLTAVDLSPASVSFAKDKAQSLNMTDITFGLADILELESLGQKFEIIESSGVLHHMDDPVAGLNVLVKCLAPDGVMRLALYSERARASIIAARQWIKDEGIEDSPEGVREARIRLRDLPDTHPAKAVIETPEYFGLSGLHDLIFNVQEHRYTPRQLKSLLNTTGLRFLGFDHTDPATTSLYASAFPDDLSQTNLDNWDVFEQNRPNTFAEMFQFWCRPVNT